MNRYILDRFKEASTWRGLALCVTACGVALRPEQIDAIIFLGLMASGVIGAIMPDNKGLK